MSEKLTKFSFREVPKAEKAPNEERPDISMDEKTMQFDLLTRHIPELQKGNYGKVVGSFFNSGHAGTAEDPIPMPYIEYSDEVNALHHDIYDFCKSHPEYDHRIYHTIFEENGLKWNFNSMSNADVSKLDAKAIIALFIGVFSAERFCDGAMMDFLENGSFIRWLKRLEELDGSNPDANSGIAMENNITELVFILDRSGSMSGLEADTIGGFNSLIEKQKKEDGICYVTTVLFDNESERIHDRVRLSDIVPMTDRDYTVRGCTALLDALGDTIRHIADIHRYARPEDVPEHTIFVITTDGMENASRRYGADQVRSMIEHEKEKHGWEFLFLAANIDAVGTASHFGIAPDHAVEYVHDSKGTKVMYNTVSHALRDMRKTRKGRLSEDWCKEIREDRLKRGK